MISKYYFETPYEILEKRIMDAKKKLGYKLLILAHHYQKDEVVKFADEIGDSLQLAQSAAKNKTAEYIVFCGVHFMAETADMLTEDYQKVILPDLNAGCTMADMVNYDDLEYAYNELEKQFGDILPLTYVNSTAAVKAFVGDHGGATVTSSNAKKIITWALDQGKKVFFMPDQHLGRNVSHDLGISLKEMATWDYIDKKLVCQSDSKNCKVILWNGFCSVHQQFTPEHVEYMRKKYPGITITVHSECSQEVVNLADTHGSTNKILSDIEVAQPGSFWAIGTDNNLVERIIKNNPDKHIFLLNTESCPCTSMNRIELPHLAWSIDNLMENRVVNQIIVDKKIKNSSIKALDKMLKLT